MMESQIQPLFQMWIIKGIVRPVNSISMNQIIMAFMVVAERSSMVRIRVKSVSLRSLNTIATKKNGDEKPFLKIDRGHSLSITGCIHASDVSFWFSQLTACVTRWWAGRDN